MTDNWNCSSLVADVSEEEGPWFAQEMEAFQRIEKSVNNHKRKPDTVVTFTYVSLTRLF